MFSALARVGAIHAVLFLSMGDGDFLAGTWSSSHQVQSQHQVLMGWERCDHGRQSITADEIRKLGQ